MSWIYRPNVLADNFEVGYFDPDAQFVLESQHENKEDAGRRVHYLNGGTSRAISYAVDRLEKALLAGRAPVVDGPSAFVPPR